MPTRTAAQKTQDQIFDSIAFLTTVWTDEGCLHADISEVTKVLGEPNYKEIAFGLAGIAQYFANAVARFEGKEAGVMRDGLDVLSDLAGQVAAQV